MRFLPVSPGRRARALLPLLAISIMLAACGGGEDDDSTASTGGSTSGGTTGGGSSGGGSTGTTGAATLTWMPPTTYTDNRPLTIDHYTIYWGQTQGSLVNSTDIPAGLSTYTVDQLASGTWYFAITAVDANGVASTFSNVASKTI